MLGRTFPQSIRRGVALPTPDMSDLWPLGLCEGALFIEVIRVAVCSSNLDSSPHAGKENWEAVEGEYWLYAMKGRRVPVTTDSRDSPSLAQNHVLP